ncbi:MAG: hypothetical protein IJ325_03810 [Clostridia bacterium]|nr:hypothetical protein [Clostridia bacterium]
MGTTKDETNNLPGTVFSDDEFLRYMELREAEKHPMITKEQMAYYMVWLLWKEPAGTAYAVLLDKRRRFLKSIKLKDSGRWQSQFFGMLEEERDRMDAAYYFVGHNHVNNPLIPSLEDREITAAMVNWKGMTFQGHFITDSALDFTEIE